MKIISFLVILLLPASAFSEETLIGFGVIKDKNHCRPLKYVEGEACSVEVEFRNTSYYGSVNKSFFKENPKYLKIGDKIDICEKPKSSKHPSIKVVKICSGADYF